MRLHILLVGNVEIYTNIGDISNTKLHFIDLITDVAAVRPFIAEESVQPAFTMP